MDHTVLYRDEDGNAQVEDIDTLDEALRRVEHLRNEVGVSDVRVLREVPITFKTYYRATVAEDGTPVSPAPRGPVSDPPPGAMPLAPSSPTRAGEEDPVPSDAEGARRGIFNRA